MRLSRRVRWPPVGSANVSARNSGVTDSSHDANRSPSLVSSSTISAFERGLPSSPRMRPIKAGKSKPTSVVIRCSRCIDSYSMGENARCRSIALTDMVSGAATKSYWASGMSSAIWIVFLRTVRNALAISFAP